MARRTTPAATKPAPSGKSQTGKQPTDKSQSGKTQSGKSKNARTSKRVPRAIREQQMLDAAISIFAEHGYRSTSMDAIAKAADTSKPMLYLYFGSKEELFLACVTRESGRLIDTLSSQIAPDDTGRERLRKVITSFLEFVETNADSWNVVYRQAEAEPPFRETVQSTRKLFIELTADLLERSTAETYSREDAELIAVALVGAGESVADRVASHAVEKRAAADLIVQLGWSGLSGTESAGVPRARR